MGHDRSLVRHAFEDDNSVNWYRRRYTSWSR